MSPGTHVTSSARTQFLEVKGGERYAYRHFGSGPGLPLLLLQHFTGTLDNWDPALTDALGAERELILFDNAGVGRSSGSVPPTVAGMAKHAAAFLDGLGVGTCDVLGFSLGGMVAQHLVLERPTIFRRLMLVGTAPRGGEDIMHLEKPRLATHLQDASNNKVRAAAQAVRGYLSRVEYVVGFQLPPLLSTTLESGSGQPLVDSGGPRHGSWPL